MHVFSGYLSISSARRYCDQSCLLASLFVRSLTPDGWPEVGQAHGHWSAGRAPGECESVVHAAMTGGGGLAEVSLYYNYTSSFFSFICV